MKEGGALGQSGQNVLLHVEVVSGKEGVSVATQYQSMVVLGVLEII